MPPDLSIAEMLSIAAAAEAAQPAPSGHTNPRPYGLVDPDAALHYVEPPPPPGPKHHSIAQLDGETDAQWEERLRSEHDARQRSEADRPKNEELLKRVLGSNYRPLPNTDSASNADPAPPMLRKDGQPLTPYDIKLAAELQRLHPYMDLGARVPPGYRR